MIEVQEALNRIVENVRTLDSVLVEVQEALNCTVAEDLYSPISMPPFNQSAMDGYALGSLNLDAYKVCYEIKAGDSSEEINLKPDEAARIFTGAMVPAGTASIAKQEIVNRVENTISLTEAIKDQENIRPLGEQIKKGELAINAGTKINPGTVGYLYALGINKVNVIRKPKVVIIATGNELTPPGEKLAPGKIYESNTFTIKSALESFGIDALIKTVPDDFESTKSMIESALAESDLLITTGGISVGDYDFVGKAVNEIGVESIFYKVKQKPGKPLFFGLQKETLVFGLPGNPAAALSCFYIYVTPAIRKLSGSKNLFLERRVLSLQTPYKKSNRISHFLKAKYEKNDVSILNSQSSAMLSSFSEANCLIHMEQAKENWAANDPVTAYIIPTN